MRHPYKHFFNTLSVLVAIVLVWRGVWILLDIVDQTLFGGSHVLTAVAGIVLGFLILYIPGRNLRDLEKLI